jgi:Fe2+ or Zn2+ uptake regulation protein
VEPKPEPKNWLVYQLLLISDDKTIDLNTNYGYLKPPTRNMQFQTVIRNVIAFTQEEAIGKFVLETSSIKCEKRIDPIDCFELHTLRKIE